MQLQQGGMTMLGYASKFMELFRFALAFLADKRLKMNWFKVGLNLAPKERMSIHQHTSYVDLHDTTVNVERTMKDRSNYFNEHHSKNHMRGGQHSNTRPRVTCNACRKPRHYARECRLAYRYFCCGSSEHQIRDCPHPLPHAGQGHMGQG